MTDAALKPCPFCGVDLVRHTRIDPHDGFGPILLHHAENDCILHGKVLYDHEFDKWNTRPSPKVRKLVWEEFSYIKGCRSGSYVVQHEHDETGAGIWVMGKDTLISEHKTEDEAKAAAQADYEARILGALE